MGLIIGGMIIGGLLGAAKSTSRQVELNEKRKELERQKGYLQKQSELYIGRYDSDGNLIEDGLYQNQANRDIAKLNANIQDATNMRDRAAGISGRQIVDQQTLNDMQIAQLEVQSAEAQGSALQSLAMSGTRRMIGTGEDQVGKVVNAGVYATREKAGASLALARTQASIQTRQSLESANYSYTNANMQIAGYRRQIQDTKDALADKIKEFVTLRDQKIEEIDYDLTYMDSSEFKWLNAMNWTTDIVGGALSYGSSLVNLFG